MLFVSVSAADLRPVRRAIMQGTAHADPADGVARGMQVSWRGTRIEKGSARQKPTSGPGSGTVIICETECRCYDGDDVGRGSQSFGSAASLLLVAVENSCHVGNGAVDEF